MACINFDDYKVNIRKREAIKRFKLLLYVHIRVVASSSKLIGPVINGEASTDVYRVDIAAFVLVKHTQH